MSSTHVATKSVSLSAVSALNASGTVSASTQSGRGSQNFAAVIGTFTRAFENGEITGEHHFPRRFSMALPTRAVLGLQSMKQAIDGLVVSMDENDAVDLSFMADLDVWGSLSARENSAFITFVQYAVWAAVKVYSLRTKDAINGFRDEARALLHAEPTHRDLIDASPSIYLKNTKNWALFKDRATGSLCFSIRGTATSSLDALVDNMTNIDANAYETVQFDSGSEDAAPFHVHRGFLDVAQAMYPAVKDLITRTAAQSSGVLIFSGHSAGGGTAFLLYHLFRSRDAELFKQFDAVHCITFGSAAIVSVPNPMESAGRSTDRIVSFVNLRDPVPRADLAYALWVADSLGKYLTRVGKYLTRVGNKSNTPPYSPLPQQQLFPGGEMVLLDEDGEAAKLTPNVLQEQAFLDLRAHGKFEYMRAIQYIFGE
ncbi:hypothetical protein H0H81_000317 [Sphagnurus paluster]|uniref:sn-1-specific diacylglycerol lipase n=1 Tax=Sphagnurus paluster TaxID=117069 RepID=A0A9P7KH34_9AGAR|nr:hypothetical protein H0H81_000317 [Sphagnurus paluster]